MASKKSANILGEKLNSTKKALKEAQNQERSHNSRAASSLPSPGKPSFAFSDPLSLRLYSQQRYHQVRWQTASRALERRKRKLSKKMKSKSLRKGKQTIKRHTKNGLVYANWPE